MVAPTSKRLRMVTPPCVFASRTRWNNSSQDCNRGHFPWTIAIGVPGNAHIVVMGTGPHSKAGIGLHQFSVTR